MRIQIIKVAFENSLLGWFVSSRKTSLWVYFRAKQQLQVLFIPPPLFTAGNPGWSAFINLCYTPDSTLWASLHFTDSWLSCAHLSLYETYWNIFILVICDYLAGMLVFYPAVLTCFFRASSPSSGHFTTGRPECAELRASNQKPALLHYVIV